MCGKHNTPAPIYYHLFVSILRILFNHHLFLATKKCGKIDREIIFQLSIDSVYLTSDTLIASSIAEREI